MKKPAKANGAGEAPKEGAPVDGSGTKADRSLKALLRGISGKSNASTGKETISHSGKLEMPELAADAPPPPRQYKKGGVLSF